MNRSSTEKPMFEVFRVDDAKLHVVVDPRAFSALHVALNAMDDPYNTYGDGCVKPNAEVTRIAHELASAIDKALEVGEGDGNPIGMARTCGSDSTGRWIQPLSVQGCSALVEGLRDLERWGRMSLLQYIAETGDPLPNPPTHALWELFVANEGSDVFAAK